MPLFGLAWVGPGCPEPRLRFHGTPDVELPAIDANEHLIEMPPPVWPRPSSSQLTGNDRAELQCPAADCLVGHIDATLNEHVLHVAVAQREAEIEPDGLLNHDARKAVAAV